MASKREQILEAINAILLTVSGVDGRVLRTQPDPNDRDYTPYISLNWDHEEFSPQTVALMERTLTVHIAVFTRGNTPDSLADPIAVDMHSKLMADTTLGGLAIDLYLNGASFEAQGADQYSGKLTHEYSVMFRHSYGDLTA